MAPKTTKKRSHPPFVTESLYDAWQLSQTQGETRRLFTFMKSAFKNDPTLPYNEGGNGPYQVQVYILAASALQALRAWALHIGEDAVPVKRIKRQDLANLMAREYERVMKESQLRATLAKVQHANPGLYDVGKVAGDPPGSAGEPAVQPGGDADRTSDPSVPDQLDPERNA